MAVTSISAAFGEPDPWHMGVHPLKAFMTRESL